MRISESKLRRIIREEATRELDNFNVMNENLGLTKFEARSLSQFAFALSRINESKNLEDHAVDFLIRFLTSGRGKKIIVSLLKVVKNIAEYNLVDLTTRHIGVPMWDKAIKTLNEKMGISLPFTAQDMYDVIKYMLPGYLLGLGINELILYLEEMSEDEWTDTVNKGTSKPKFKIGDEVNINQSSIDSSLVFKVTGVDKTPDGFEYALQTEKDSEGAYSETSFPEKHLTPAVEKKISTTVERRAPRRPRV
jgi:hypothetical protein